jgi:hypothetical protein
VSDLFITKKWDMQLHHVLGLLLIGYKYNVAIHPEHDTSIILALYKTELSTFFYVFNSLLQEIPQGQMVSIVSTINSAVFFMTFFKFRVYDLYKDIIINENVYTIYDKYPYSNIMMIVMNGMYILNLYWCMLLCKIIVKPFIKNWTNGHWICHKVTSYTMTVNLLIAGVLYTYQPDKRIMYDMVGLTLLAMASYQYHNDICKILEEKRELDYLNEDVIVPYIQDVGAIHLRSFMATVTNYGVSYPEIIIFSAVSHSVCYAMNIQHIYYTKHRERRVIYGDNPEFTTYMKRQNIFTIVPVATDIMMICFHSRAIYDSIHGFYSAVIMGLLLMTNPFYDLTHIAFHLCLLVHTYTFAKCNMFVIYKEDM